MGTQIDYSEVPTDQIVNDLHVALNELRAAQARPQVQAHVESRLMDKSSTPIEETAK